MSGNSDLKIVNFNHLKLCKAGIHFTQPPLVDHERTAHLISPPSDATAAHDTIRDKISYW